MTPLSPGLALALWDPQIDSGESASRPSVADSSHAMPTPPREEGRSGNWRILPRSPDAAIGDGSILLILRDRLHAPMGEAPAPMLRVFPLPARDACTILWNGPLDSPFRWEIFDVGGRSIARGESPARGVRSLRLPMRDAAGRPLPGGIYWIRVAEGDARAVVRLPVIH